MSSITLLGSFYAKQNRKILIKYVQNLRAIYTLSKKTEQFLQNQPLVLLGTGIRPLSSSIVWSKEEVPKGFEKFFPKNKKTGDTPATNESQETNPFKKFISNEGGNSGGGGGKSSEDRFISAFLT